MTDLEQRLQEQERNERTVTLWSRWQGEGWVWERSYPLRYWLEAVNKDLSLEQPFQSVRRPGREYQLFEQGVNPNS